MKNDEENSEVYFWLFVVAIAVIIAFTWWLMMVVK